MTTRLCKGPVVTKRFCKSCVVDPDLRQNFVQKSATKIFGSPPTLPLYNVVSNGRYKDAWHQKEQTPTTLYKGGGEANQKNEKKQKRKSEVKFRGGLEDVDSDKRWRPI